jgi:hypothetical protein
MRLPGLLQRRAKVTALHQQAARALGKCFIRELRELTLIILEASIASSFLQGGSVMDHCLSSCLLYFVVFNSR